MSNPMSNEPDVAERLVKLVERLAAKRPPDERPETQETMWLRYREGILPPYMGQRLQSLLAEAVHVAKAEGDEEVRREALRLVRALRSGSVVSD